MKLIVLFIALNLGSAFGAKLDQQAIDEICTEAGSRYEVDPDWKFHAGPDYRWRYKIQISAKLCNSMKHVASDTKKQRVGSKTYVVGKGVVSTRYDITCASDLKRSVQVTLDPQNNPIITVSPWYVSDLTCKRIVDKAVITAKVGDKNVVRIPTNSVGLYQPDYLELGEPDDGGGTRNYYDYKVLNSSGNTVGFISEFTYYNSEGDWATKYIFKYNQSRGYLETRLDKDDVDYDDEYDDYAYIYQELAYGAQYISESDSPWLAFSAEFGKNDKVTRANVEDALDLPRGHEFSKWNKSDLKEFWEYYTDPATYGAAEAKAYKALKNALERDLSDISLYKSGDPAGAEFKIYLLGKDIDGNLVGVTAISIET